MNRYGYTATRITVFLSILLMAAGGAVAGTVTLTVHDYPAGDGPTGLASNGVPFQPGALSNASNLKLMDGSVEVPVAVRVLARWHGDNSIRAVLLQFNAGSGTGTKDYTLHVGESRTSSDIPLTTVTWDFPEKIFTMRPQYMCDSKVVWEQRPLGSTGFPDWEQKQISSYGSTGRYIPTK